MHTGHRAFKSCVLSTDVAERLSSRNVQIEIMKCFYLRVAQVIALLEYVLERFQASMYGRD